MPVLLTKRFVNVNEDFRQSTRRVVNQYPRDRIKTHPVIKPVTLRSGLQYEPLHPGLLRPGADRESRDRFPIAVFPMLGRSRHVIDPQRSLGENTCGRGDWQTIPIPHPASKHSALRNALVEYLREPGDRHMKTSGTQRAKIVSVVPGSIGRTSISGRMRAGGLRRLVTMPGISADNLNPYVWHERERLRRISEASQSSQIQNAHANPRELKKLAAARRRPSGSRLRLRGPTEESGIEHLKSHSQRRNAHPSKLNDLGTRSPLGQRAKRLPEIFRYIAKTHGRITSR